MRILSKYKNEVKLRVEALDDLWHLFHILKKGDYMSGLTTRSIKMKEGVEKERKTVRLEIEVEKIGFQAFSGDMRVSGAITYGPEDIPLGDHHTFIIKPGSEIKIKKDWKRWELERLKESQSSQPQIGIVVMDNESALMGITSMYGIKTLAKIHSHFPKKGEPGFELAQKTYFGEIAAAIPTTDKVIIGGPGFAKDNFSSFLKDKHPDISERCIFTSTSTATETGFREIVANKLDKVLKDARMSKEEKLLENFVQEIGKEGLVTYGFEEVKKVVESGAVNLLLVGEKMLIQRRLGEDLELDRLMEMTRSQGGKVEVISKLTEAGKKLEGFGGIGAFLRYRV
jgi:protein pelota